MGRSLHPSAGFSSNHVGILWSGDGADLETFVLELPSQTAVIASSPPGATIGFNGTVGFYGATWQSNDVDVPPNTPVSFSVTLEEQLATEESEFAVKAGSYPEIRTICGPSPSSGLVTPLPVLDLNCALTDECKCTVELSWTNQQTDYDAIRIEVDGNLVTEIPGDFPTPTPSCRRST